MHAGFGVYIQNQSTASYERLILCALSIIYACMVGVCACVYVILTYRIKTHNSESRGQEEAGCTQRMSVLFTGSTGVKFVNALNKPPLKLSLRYQGLSTF